MCVCLHITSDVLAAVICYSNKCVGLGSLKAATIFRGGGGWLHSEEFPIQMFVVVDTIRN